MERQSLCETGWQATGGKTRSFLTLIRSVVSLRASDGSALYEAADRCEAVLFLVSEAWLGSPWCRKEFNLALRLNKRLFAVLIEDLPINRLPVELGDTWQVVRLAAGRDHVMLHAVVPITQEEVHVTFSTEGLQRLKHGLEEAGLEAKYFSWPPAEEPDRAPYRGLRPLEAEDCGIFFGRGGAIVEALDLVRGLVEMPPPRFFVVLGASGAGKSSFLRAGLLPRLARDDRHFLPLPVIRPERAAVTGDTGLLIALESALRVAGIATTRARLRDAVGQGAPGLRPILRELAKKKAHAPLDGGRLALPTLILLIDQGEELFGSEGQEEAEALLALVRDLVGEDPPAMLVIFGIRSDFYEHVQESPLLGGIRKVPFDLGPMPKGSYADVIKGPAERLADTRRRIEIEEGLVDALLSDIEQDGAKDALPLLAYTLERLYIEHGGDGDLTLSGYRSLGGIRGSIEAAVARALRSADYASEIPKDAAARQALLRQGLIPWLAGIDPDTGAPRRRIALLSEIPEDSLPLIRLLVDQRLLTIDVAKDTGAATIEPAHEALLRQWDLLQSWLTEDAGLLAVLESVKRASRDWDKNERGKTWLVHATHRLLAAEKLTTRPDLAAHLAALDREYLAACRKAEAAASRRRKLVQGLVYTLLVGIIAGLLGWINQDYIKDRVTWVMVTRPYMYRSVAPYVLPLEAEREFKPGATFTECDKDCPLMVVIPAGDFMMGSPADEPGRAAIEGPPHEVKIGRRFAVASDEAVFSEWDLCVKYGDCPPISDGGWGRGNGPVINITWFDAKRYVAWLSRMTGRDYRLLAEAEYEYATRAHTTTGYYWGPNLGKGNASCNGCGTKYDGVQPAPAGSFPANGFGLHDMVGNVWEWVDDCYNASYEGAPTDGSAWIFTNCPYRVARGGTWTGLTKSVLPRSAIRDWRPPDYPCCGFRVARTLVP